MDEVQYNPAMCCLCTSLQLLQDDNLAQIVNVRVCACACVSVRTMRHTHNWLLNKQMRKSMGHRERAKDGNRCIRFWAKTNATLDFDTVKEILFTWNKTLCSYWYWFLLRFIIVVVVFFVIVAIHTNCSVIRCDVMQWHAIQTMLTNCSAGWDNGMQSNVDHIFTHIRSI